jgi:neutral ceramidase
MGILRVGHARECITPPLGIRMVGYASRTEGAAEVHDDLFLNAVALRSDEETVAILAYDLCGYRGDLVEEIKSALHEAAGLRPAQVLLNTSHTHAGPATGGREDSPEDQMEYRQQVIRQSVKALRSAVDDLSAASLSAGSARVDVGGNRIQKFEDGHVWLGHNPNGPALQEMTVWRLARQDRPDIVFFSTPMHGTTLGPRNLCISAEWMGLAVLDLEAASSDLRAVFLQGCAGDQDPYYSMIDGVRGTFEEMEQHGKNAADSVRQALREMRELEALPLRSVVEVVELPPKEEGAEASQLPLHGIRLGEAVLLGLGCEAFVEYAMYGRKVSPAKETLILGYTDGGIGYLPAAYAYEMGGYEAKSTRAGPESEFIVKAAMEKVLKELID